MEACASSCPIKGMVFPTPTPAPHVCTQVIDGTKELAKTAETVALSDPMLREKFSGIFGPLIHKDCFRSSSATFVIHDIISFCACSLSYDSQSFLNFRLSRILSREVVNKRLECYAGEAKPWSTMKLVMADWMSH